MAQRRKKADEEKKEKQPPITMGEATRENPSGIEAVSEEHAQHLGQLRGFGGHGAVGATVAGPAVHVATEGGTKPLPVAGHPDDVETSAGGDTSDQETSQAAALQSGEENEDENAGSPEGERTGDE